MIFFFENMEYKEFIGNINILKIKKNKLTNLFQYLIFIIIFLLNIHLTNKIKINLFYKNNNTNLRKINKYIIICQQNELINGIRHSFFEPKITSIIIIYNAEKSISTAIRSIQNQNMTDIEILLIDDCSLDNSLKIIEKFQKEDKRIKIIKNKKNKGALFSRSLGALKSKGKYIL